MTTKRKSKTKAKNTPRKKAQPVGATPEQLVTALGSVFGYLENMNVPGNHESISAHGVALKQLAAVQDALIKRFEVKV